ncbi:hypothetical protein GH733_016065 [Mirounga leonina]|nr:hypothetical protein GH733_016065 [Mirounga leonina]
MGSQEGPSAEKHRGVDVNMEGGMLLLWVLKFSNVHAYRGQEDECSMLKGPGHYIYVDTSFAKQGEKAVLLSSDLQAEEWSCLRLVYQITTSPGSSSDTSRLNLYVRFEDESFDRLLWSAKEPSDSWLIASLDLQNSSKKFKILIEGVLGQGNTASIALFEIKMTTGYCIECDFEENHLCGFVNHWNPNVNWFVGGGNIRNSPSILLQDHTFKSELGELGTDGVLFLGGVFPPSPPAPSIDLTVALSTEKGDRRGFSSVQSKLQHLIRFKSPPDQSMVEP